MDTTQTTVSRELALRLLGPTGPGRDLTASLRYDIADPFAVHTIFQTGAAEPVVWVFARDLLLDSLLRAAGSGDVTGSPGRDALGRSVVHLRLRSPEGSALLQVSAAEVESFLEQTYALVPIGDEASYLDLDSMIEELLTAR